MARTDKALHDCYQTTQLALQYLDLAESKGEIHYDDYLPIANELSNTLAKLKEKLHVTPE